MPCCLLVMAVKVTALSENTCFRQFYQQWEEGKRGGGYYSQKKLFILREK
jgi:hypothetical protein